MNKLRKILVASLILSVMLGSLARSNAKAQQNGVDRNSESGAIAVEVVMVDGHYRLLRDGHPYKINGVGIDTLKGPAYDGMDLEVFARHGGTAYRNWRDLSTTTGGEYLDKAAQNGLTVAMTIPIGRERHGFDYDDEHAVADQLAFARSEVLKYKDHPALLMWIIGNEINFSFKNPKVFSAVNEISEMIHELDGKHPTTTTLADFDGNLAGLTEQLAPDLDFVSIQMYGNIVNLPKIIQRTGYEKPYCITEWGTIGHWEVDKTSWGAPIELNSSDKAQNYLDSYRIAIASNPRQLVCSFAFLWGHKQERTPTWYGMFLADGSETETVDVLHHIWNDEWPENRSPRVSDLLLDSKGARNNVKLDAGGKYPASIEVKDPDNDPLTYRWVILKESTTTQQGGDKEDVPAALVGLVEAAEAGTAYVTAPSDAGAYRLFVYAHDGQGHAGHANIPFLVK